MNTRNLLEEHLMPFTASDDEFVEQQTKLLRDAFENNIEDEKIQEICKKIYKTGKIKGFRCGHGKGLELSRVIMINAMSDVINGNRQGDEAAIEWI